MLLDHFNLLVPPSQLEATISFLTSSLAHMGFKELERPIPTVVGLGETAAYFWIGVVEPDEVDEKSLDYLLRHNHIAFTAESQFPRPTIRSTTSFLFFWLCLTFFTVFLVFSTTLTPYNR